MANNSIIKYNVLSKLSLKTISDIKSVQIFGETGNEVLILTTDDKVYGFGDNFYGSLGLGHNTAVDELEVVSELCGQELIKFDCIARQKYVIVLGLTRMGRMYVWGCSDSTYTTPQLVTSLQAIPVLDMSCSVWFTHVLTQSAEVYRLLNRDPNTCVKLNQFNGEKVTAISSGFEHTLALTESGDVFVWGTSSRGQLGLADIESSNEFKKIDSIVGVVSKISCGPLHSLVLTIAGQICAFGANSLCQLGVGDKLNRNKPTIIDSSVKFVDIFADKSTNISMALSEEGVVYVWGECKDGVIDCPQRTDLTTFQDSIIQLCKHVFTHRLVLYKELFVCHRVLKTMSNAFNCVEDSDLWFRFSENNEIKFIYCHKWFVKMNSQYLRTMIDNAWSDNKAIGGHIEVEVTQHSYECYYAFLRFLYTDSIETKDMNVLNELLDIAVEYRQDFYYKCSQTIKHMITKENVLEVYALSVKYSSIVLENYCFDLIVNSKSLQIMTQTEAFERMEPIYSKHLFKRYIAFNESQSESNRCNTSSQTIMTSKRLKTKKF